jgi:uncharacterized protein (TIGR00255 family)
MEVIILVRSMTGYGRYSAALDNLTITTEVRTVNHRFLDISIKMPRNLLYLEDKLKKIASNYFHRGRVDIFITIDGEGLTKKSLSIDWELLDHYIEGLNKIKERYHLNTDPTIHDIIAFHDAFSVVEKPEENTLIEEILFQCVEKSILDAVNMRIIEGKSLRNDMLRRLENIQSYTEKLSNYRESVIEQYRKRITERVEDFLHHTSMELDQRIYQEIALLAEKGDITEEIDRLHSHIEQFLATLDKNEPIGRILDFLVQEMHRESNTIGSKSNDGQMSKWVVMLKTEIEKVKEQAQNIE